MKSKIVFVDDETQILRALRRIFYKTDYECYYFENGNDAIVFMSENSIDILVTDIRMPIMNGIELLKYAKEKHPSTIRVILSGYSDSSQIMGAVAGNLAKFYLYKPWNNDELMDVISVLFEQRKTMEDKKLLSIINSIGELPTLPDLYMNICSMIQSDSSMNELAVEIGKDPAIASRILRIANTAFYGKRTGNINQAIVLLGLNNVKNIIISTTVLGMNDGVEELELLWKHAMITNKMSQYLYQKLYSTVIPLEASTAGLLHSIGIPFLLTTFKEKYKEVLLIKDQNPEMKINEIEEKIFGVSHSLIGSYLLDWWELPFSIAEVSREYLKPFDNNLANDKLVVVVNFSSYYAWTLIGDTRFQCDLHEETVKFLGITDKLLNELSVEFGKTVDRGKCDS
jgi:HD-like signal output (HDOD) protein